MSTVMSHPQLVHEAEAQRQYPRVRIPGTLSLDAGGRTRVHRLIDVSAGGVAFEADAGDYRVGDTLRATLGFAVEPVGLSLPVRLRVRNLDARGVRVGCEFEELGSREISVLRQLIGAFLAGDVVSVGEVLTTLSRDNHVKPRNGGEAAAAPRLGLRARTFALTVLMCAAGAAAFLYTATKLYGVLFVTRASAAKVAAPSYAITMPRDGTYFSLIPPDNKVKKGQPLGTFQAAMLDVVQNDPGALQLSPQQISMLMGETLKGTLSSPCDCTVHNQYALDSQFVNRNQPLMELLPDDARPYVLARFHFDDIDHLAVGRHVLLRISGEDGDRTGTIRQLRLLPGPASTTDLGAATDLRGLNTPGPISDVIVEIEPGEPIDRSLIERPVDVSLGDPRSRLAGLFSGLAGLGRRFEVAGR